MKLNIEDFKARFKGRVIGSSDKDYRVFDEIMEYLENHGN
jgi:hypothetical protein